MTIPDFTRVIPEINSASAGPSVGSANATSRAGRRLFDYLPVGLFGSVLGLTGLSVIWRLAHQRYGTPIWVGDAIAASAVLDFLVLTVAYSLKCITAPDAVRSEFRHPIAGNLFATVLVSLLLLPIVIAPVSLLTARVSWIIGVVGMLIFAWFIVNRWMSDKQQIAHATPAWILPVVGLIDIPLAIPSLSIAPPHALMVLSLAVGMFFAVILFTLIFSRLVFEPPMPDALQPTLLILIAPFAVGFSSYITTTGQVDLFAQALYLLTLFLLTVLLGRLRHALLCCPFRFAWWAVSFPLAAVAIAALGYATAEPGHLADGIALVLMSFATLAIVALLGRTLIGVLRGELKALSS